MAFRCINAFAVEGRVIAGGALIDDDDAILGTHLGYFVHVDEPSKGGETASVDTPRRGRRPAKVADDAAAAADA